MRPARLLPLVLALHAALPLQQQLAGFGSLLFFKDFRTSQVTANADYAKGSLTCTVTCTRSGAAPGTYCDAAGIVQSLTTSDVPRFTQGFWDETGYHVRPGILVERGALSNRALRSQSFTDAVWIKTGITAVDSVAAVGAIVPATLVSTLTATTSNATITQSFTDAVAGVWTSSIYVQRKTGTGAINFRSHTSDSYVDISAQLAGGIFIRRAVSSSSLTNPTWDLQIATSGDELYVVQADLVKSTRMTSPVPTAGSARTRNAETYEWVVSGNRSAASETMFMRYTPLGSSFVNDGVQRTLSSSATKDRSWRKLTTGTTMRIVPNVTDSGTSLATGVVVPAAGQSILGGCALWHSDPLAIARIYANGSLDGVQAAIDFTDPAWGTLFQLGSSNSSSNQLDGIIESVAIYSDFKDVPDANGISYAMAPDIVAKHTYSFDPNTYSSANLISGGASGTQIVNSNYQFNDTLVRLNTSTALLYRRIGQDGDDAEPAGNITLRVFDIPTRAFGSETLVYTSGPTWQVKHHMIRVVGTEVWLYVLLMARPLGTATTAKISLYKSTNGGLTFGSEIVVQGLVAGNPTFGGYIDGPGSTDYLVVIGRNAGNMLELIPSTDGGTTFGTGIVIAAAASGPDWGEGDFLNVDSAGRIIGVLRDNAGAVLAQMVSSDWGVTWSAPFSTGLGAVTGAKVTPKLIHAAGDPGRLIVYTTDRGAGNQTKISGPTSVDAAFAGTWRSLYSFASTFSNQGNGAIVVIDETLREYLMTTANEVGSSPVTTDTHWWRFRDLYTWTATS